MNIRQHVMEAVRAGRLDGEITQRDGVPGLLIHDGRGFIPFDRLGYDEGIDYFDMADFRLYPVASVATNENPETVHRLGTADDEMAAWVWVDGDGDPHHLGDISQVADLYQALGALLLRGEHDPEVVDENDPAWGNSYAIADAVREAMGAGYSDNAAQLADTIREAARQGRIRGATNRNGRWYLPPRTFRYWLVRSQNEKRGRPRKED